MIVGREEPEDCIHGLGPVESCTICNGREADRRKEERRIDFTFQAKFDSICSVCENTVDHGDLLGKTVSEKYVCSDCITYDPKTRKSYAIR